MFSAARAFKIYSQFVTTVHLLVIIYEVHIFDFTLCLTKYNSCIYKAGRSIISQKKLTDKLGFDALGTCNLFEM